MLKNLFKRKTPEVATTSRLILFLNNFFEKKVESASYFLSRGTQKLSLVQLRYGLYGFVLIGVLVNSFIIVAAIKSNPSLSSPSFGSIARPSSTVVHPLPYNRNETIESLPLRKLDSIQQTEEGKQQLLLYIKQHPHFQDSVQRLKDLLGDY